MRKRDGGAIGNIQCCGVEDGGSRALIERRMEKRTKERESPWARVRPRGKRGAINR